MLLSICCKSASHGATQSLCRAVVHQGHKWHMRLNLLLPMSHSHHLLRHSAGALHPIIDMYQEVACPVMPVQTGINGLKTVPAVGSPATDMSRTPLQQPSLTPQQQAMQKAQAMLALHQQRQGAASALAPAADLQSGHPSRMQPRLAPPASISTPGIFMPASTGKAQRSIEQRPARHTAEPGTIASSAIPGSEAAASHAAPSLASLKPFDMASSTQPQQTFVHELIETDIL